MALLCGREEFPFPAESVTTWRKTAPDIQSYLFFDGDRAVGYGEVWLDDEEDEVELARIIVDPVLRRQGIGAELVRALLTPALAADHPDVFLRVRPDNVAAIRTYLGVGFVDVSQQEMDGMERRPAAGVPLDALPHS